MAQPRKTLAAVTPLRGATQADIEQRKRDHIDIILSGRARHTSGNSFDAFDFVHDALPDIDFGAIDLGTTFLGKRLRLPYLASSMTGGPVLGGAINRNIAEAAQAMGFAMGVGSQRIALGGGSGHGLDSSVRKIAPDIALYANLGAVQFARGMSVDDARRAVETIQADALILHLNPLQEVLQPGGDVDWRGVAKAIEGVCRGVGVPVIAKEVGAGISAAVAVRLADLGVAAIDVAGTGGSSWAAVEGLRQPELSDQELGEIYRNWGIATADALNDIRSALPAMPLIASGGIRHGLDGAKALRIGANLVGQASQLLRAATIGADQVVNHVKAWEKAFKIACFCTNSATLAKLHMAALQSNEVGRSDWQPPPY
jgi:isopentenyl-diphosphate Delta-isomerase